MPRKIRGEIIEGKDIPINIRWIVHEFSPSRFADEYASFLRAWKTSGFLVRTKFLRDRHPWLRFVHELIEKNYNFGLIEEREIQLGLERVAADARKLQILLEETKMPEPVRQHLVSDLWSIENGAATLFEVDVAFHFWRMGANIEWIVSDAKHSEFVVFLPDEAFEFVVECKRFDADSGRALRKRDFYALTDKVADMIDKPKLSGHIQLLLQDGLPSSDIELGQLVAAIATQVPSLRGRTELPHWRAELSGNVMSAAGIVVATNNPHSFARSYGLPGSLQVLWSNADEITSPLIFSVASKQQAKIYIKLRRLFRNAREQIGTKNGVISIYYDNLEAGDLPKFRSVETFNLFNHLLLDKESSENILALCYVAGPFNGIGTLEGALAHEALQYKNPRSSMPTEISFVFD